MITPSESQAIDERLAKRIVDNERKLLMDVMKNGIGLMANGKPRERLAAYESRTYAPDKMLLMNPNYFQQRRDGTAQPLMAEQMEAAYAEQMQAHQRYLDMGLDPNVLPQLEEPLLYWAQLLRLPFGIELAEYAASDWRKLERELHKREEQG